MANYAYWPVTIAASVALYVVLSQRLKTNAQPLRLELADKGELLLASSHLSEVSRTYVRSLLNSAFSYRGHLLVALGVIPVFAIASVFGRLNSITTNGPLGEKGESSPAVRALVGELTDLHIRITIANHPLLMSIVLFWGAAIFLLASIAAAVIRGVVPRAVSRELLVERVDHAYAAIPLRIRSYANQPRHC